MTVLELLATQDGVISREQVLAAGESDKDIKRRLERREWKRLHPGVYVAHTGPPTWRQRAWAGVLFYWPAALEGPSALHAAGVRGYESRDGAPVHVVVDRTRTVRRRVGITVFQAARAETLVSPHVSPPRQTVEHALLSVASRKRRLDAAVAVLADAVQDGRTTAGRLRTALTFRPRLRNRAVLWDVLVDVGEGVRSVLEFRYLNRVERPHGLPSGERQQPVLLNGRKTYPDVGYKAFRTLVHLDGRVGHAGSLDRGVDFGRDLSSHADDMLSVRLGWTQILEPCRTAQAVAVVLQRRGWTGSPYSCGSLCTAFPTPGVEFAVQSR